MSEDDPTTRARGEHLREARLAEMFVRLADTLGADVDVGRVLRDLCHLCVDVLGASTAGVLLAHPDTGLQVAAASDEGSRLLELYQVEAASGPCLDAFTTGRPVEVHDLQSSGGAWPAFSALAGELGYRAVQAFPMTVHGVAVGALDLFYEGPRTASARDTEVTQALADVASIGVLQLRRFHDRDDVARQLQHALTSRVAIEQAKGMLAADADLGLQEAFEVIRRYARDHNQKLSAVAEQITARELAAEALLEGRPSKPTAAG